MHQRKFFLRLHQNCHYPGVVQSPHPGGGHDIGGGGGISRWGQGTQRCQFSYTVAHGTPFSVLCADEKCFLPKGNTLTLPWTAACHLLRVACCEHRGMCTFSEAGWLQLCCVLNLCAQDNVVAGLAGCPSPGHC